MAGMNRIFISYAKEDAAFAKKLYDDLKTAGADPWLDSVNLLPGQDWELEIKKAVRDCTYFLAVISERSVEKKGYVQKELRLAIDVLDELPPGKVYVIPARLDDSQPAHQRLGKLHWVDLFPSYDDGLSKIKRSLRLGPGDSSKPAPPISPRPKRRPMLTDIPDDVAEIIASAAESDFPDDFQTRRSQISSEQKAWRKLQTYEAPNIPHDVLDVMRRRAAIDFGNDFSTQLSQINNEVQAWRALKTYEPPNIPHDVLDVIRRCAAVNFGNDFSTQLFQINNEVQAWRALETYEAPNIPHDVLDVIRRRAAVDFGNDFSTQLFQINNEVQAWHDLQNIDEPSIPPDVLDSITASATTDNPDGFSTRLFQIRNEVQAWRELHHE